MASPTIIPSYWQSIHSKVRSFHDSRALESFVRLIPKKDGWIPLARSFATLPLGRGSSTQCCAGGWPTYPKSSISRNEPSARFDYTTGKRIGEKLLAYNQEAERFLGYSYEVLSEVSPVHHFLAYTIYDKDKDPFTLSVTDLTMGSLCGKPQVD